VADRLAYARSDSHWLPHLRSHRCLKPIKLALLGLIYRYSTVYQHSLDTYSFLQPIKLPQLPVQYSRMAESISVPVLILNLINLCMTRSTTIRGIVLKIGLPGQTRLVNNLFRHHLANPKLKYKQI
jgi:hypothetical protein